MTSIEQKQAALKAQHIQNMISDGNFQSAYKATDELRDLLKEELVTQGINNDRALYPKSYDVNGVWIGTNTVVGMVETNALVDYARIEEEAN